jgi:hypothetical protein
MCLQARDRYNAEVAKHYKAEREQYEREAAERRAAGIPDPKPVVYEPQSCTGQCVSEAKASGSDSDSAVSRCHNCDFYVCLDCGKAPAPDLFGACDPCSAVRGQYDEADFGDYDDQPDLRSTLNTLVARIVSAGGPGYPQVQAQLNRHMGVQQRQHATEAQLERGVARAERWLAQLGDDANTADLPWPAPRQKPPQTSDLSATEVAELRQLITEATAIIDRLRAFEQRLSQAVPQDRQRQ